MVNSSCCVHLLSLFCSNIEDIARDAGSVDVDEESLLCKSIATFVPLKPMFPKSYCFVKTHAKLN